MTTIKNKTARLLVVERFPLVPGDNPKKNEPPIPGDLLASILANDQFKLWQRLGWVKVKMGFVSQEEYPAPDPEPPPAAPEPPPAAPEPPPAAPEPLPAAPESEPVSLAAAELMALGTAEARTVIRDCTDALALLEVYERDKRKTIKDWCEHRIKQLEEIAPEE